MTRIWKYRHGLIGALVFVILGLFIAASLYYRQLACSPYGEMFLHAGPTCTLLVQYLSPVVVAAGFGIVGITACLVNCQDESAVFFIVGAFTLTAGNLSSIGSDIGARLFYVLLAWLTPLTILFHLRLLDRRTMQNGRPALAAGAIVAAILSAPPMLSSFAALQTFRWFPLWQAAVRLCFAVTLLLAGGWLIGSYSRRASVLERRRVRLIGFGTYFAAVPLLFLSLLPDTLGASIYIPYEATFLWLLLAPLAYGYARIRHRMVWLEPYVYRALLVTLLLTAFMGICIVWITVTNSMPLDEDQRQLLLGAMISVSVLAVPKTYRKLERLIRWVMYGHEIEDRPIVDKLASALAHAVNYETLRQLLLNDLATVMRIPKLALYLRQDEGHLTLLDTTGVAKCRFASSISEESTLVSFLATSIEPVSHNRVRRKLSCQAQLTESERSFVMHDDVALWLPLTADGQLHGLLVIGTRTGDEFFTVEDCRMLKRLGAQAGLAAQTIRLLDQMQARQQDLLEAHRHVLKARERERIRMAHKLHDEVLQQVLAVSRLLDSFAAQNVSISLPALKGYTLADTRAELLHVVTLIRGLVGELRPSGLLEVGLERALEAEIARIAAGIEGDRPQFVVDISLGDREQPESIIVCLFRVAQESLRNAVEHADAAHIYLSLHNSTDELVLRVRDDGRGFEMPARLRTFSQDDHYGIIGMVERVDWAGGDLKIDTVPGEGTTITACVPLTVEPASTDSFGREMVV